MDSMTPLPTQVDDLDPTAHARRDDPFTSHLAAKTVNLTRRQVQVLEVFRQDNPSRAFVQNRGEGGFTDEEMVLAVQGNPPSIGPPSIRMEKMPSPSGLRTARKALVDAGLLDRAPAGSMLRRTRLGNWAFVWVLTPAGRDFELPK